MKKTKKEQARDASRFLGAQIGYAVADLEALRDFAPPPEAHMPKLDRAIKRLKELQKSLDT